MKVPKARRKMRSASSRWWCATGRIVMMD